MKVDQTKAGRQIAAYVVLDRKCQMIGKILVYHGEGRTTVNVWDLTREYGDRYFEATASGYGYDRTTAALRGLTCGGLRMYDHCEPSKEATQAMKQYMALPDSVACEPYTHGKTREIDRFFARWAKKGVNFTNHDRETRRYGSAYMKAGVEGLAARGLRVIQAI